MSLVEKCKFYEKELDKRDTIIQRAVLIGDKKQRGSLIRS
jgi:predicted nuclease with TOPRIM domain